MKGKDFIEKIQELDEDLIEEAAEPERRKGMNYNYIKFVGVAACISVLVGVSLWQSVTKNDNGPKNFYSAGSGGGIIEVTTGIEDTEEKGTLGEIVPGGDTSYEIAIGDNETEIISADKNEIMEETSQGNQEITTETFQENQEQGTGPDGSLIFNTKYYVEIDGKKYYSTGKKSDITARCGMMDGEVILGNSIYSNMFGFQRVSETEVDVYINQEWVRFSTEKGVD